LTSYKTGLEPRTHEGRGTYDGQTMAKSYSVSIRLQRVTVESAHVSVALSDELMEADPTVVGQRINTEKLVQAAMAIGRLASTVWTIEGEPKITMHPVQTAPKLA
jgi:hypothetical protein